MSWINDSIDRRWSSRLRWMKRSLRYQMPFCFPFAIFKISFITTFYLCWNKIHITVHVIAEASARGCLSLIKVSIILLTPRGDKHVNSPYSIHTLSGKKVMRISNLLGRSCFLERTPNSCYLYTRKSVTDKRKNKITYLEIKGLTVLRFFITAVVF